ncbi:MAG: recombinase family protein, partial [Candidatus Hydrogenedentes bacterium]|nr:recombinase family protein [Candidatus Hydrogenedentota bacterium]
IGYARVSTQDQNLALQREALTNAGCQKVFEDKVSGTRAERPGLAKALEMLRDGDTLVVAKEGAGKATVRLLGIKAFEAKQAKDEAAMHGRQAEEALRRLATGQPLRSFALGAPPEAGDFEGLAITPAGAFYMITSTGQIYSFREGGAGASVAFERFDTGLAPACEIE